MPRIGADPLLRGVPANKEEIMSLRGRLAMLGAVALIAGACSSGGAATAAPSAAAPATAAPVTAAPVASAPAASVAAATAAPATPIPGGLLAKVLAAGKLVVSTDPELRPAVCPDGGRHVRGLRHRRGHRDRQAAWRHGRVGDARLGDHHRRRLGRTLGRERGLDDRDHRAREGTRLQRPVLLHARPDDRERRVRHHDPRRAWPARPCASASRRPTSTG